VILALLTHLVPDKQFRQIACDKVSRGNLPARKIGTEKPEKAVESHVFGSTYLLGSRSQTRQSERARNHRNFSIAIFALHAGEETSIQKRIIAWSNL